MTQKTTEAIIPASTVMRLLIGAMCGGAVVAALFALQAPGKRAYFALLTLALAVSGAAALCGLLLGFIFGIPRSLQSSDAAGAAGATGGNGYRANTSLEQISDWLTKILVGVGLTQLTQLPQALESYARYVGAAFGPYAAGAPVFVGALSLHFVVCGFLAGYLWTRLRLGQAFSEADVVTRAEFEQGQKANALALALVERQLQPQHGGAAPTEDELTRAIDAADDLYRSHIFGLAKSERELAHDKRDGRRAARTIPIFRALVAHSGDKYHVNYGQMGYAMLDAEPPDLAGCESMLSEAIRVRGPEWSKYGFLAYELVRARCRIRLLGGRAPSPEERRRITDDLKVLQAWPLEHCEPETQQEIVTWLHEQHAAADLDPATQAWVKQHHRAAAPAAGR